MIVNSRDDGWEVIYQRSHANLAAILTNAWRKADHVPRWTELVIATAQHDDQEMFWDSSRHLTKLGAPIDFTQSDLETSRIEARRVIENAYRQGVWIALLISCHNSYLYEPMRGEDKQLDAFLDEQRENQQRWRKQVGFDKKTVEQAYSLLRWGDQLSLILCRNELPKLPRMIDVDTGPDGKMVRAAYREDGTVTLDPWVLEDSDISFSVEVRHLKQLKFDDEETFLKLLGEAPIEARSWHFKR
jgi:hypothetical protein